jgi:hypothetical protein
MLTKEASGVLSAREAPCSARELSSRCFLRQHDRTRLPLSRWLALEHLQSLSITCPVQKVQNKGREKASPSPADLRYSSPKEHASTTTAKIFSPEDGVCCKSGSDAFGGNKGRASGGQKPVFEVYRRSTRGPSRGIQEVDGGVSAGAAGDWDSKNGGVKRQKKVNRPCLTW